MISYLKEQSKKLENRENGAALIGCFSSQKAYKLRCDLNQKVVHSRNFVFEKDAVFFKFHVANLQTTEFNDSTFDSNTSSFLLNMEVKYNCDIMEAASKTSTAPERSKK